MRFHATIILGALLLAAHLPAQASPGDAALSSEEFQQYERTRRLFGEFAELAKVRPRLNRGEAIALWHSLGRETLFQAESPDTPIAPSQFGAAAG